MSTPIEASPNVGNQLERAILWYLQQCLAGAWQNGIFVLQDPLTVQNSIAANYNFYFSNDWKVRTAPLYEVLAHTSTENPKHSRNEDFQVAIKAEWPGNNIAGELNPDTNWVAINKQIGMAMAAMSQTDDSGQTYRAACAAITAAGRQLASIGSAQDQANNSDMASFTVTYLEYKGAMRAKIVDGTMIIMEVRNFEVHACGQNVD